MKYLLERIFQKIHATTVPKCMSSSLSDNQAYPQICIQASHDYRVFNMFRRNPVYCEILEHVSEKEGHEYLKIISKQWVR